MLEFGFSKSLITPSLPIDLGGYADREGPATDVHDDLFVRACYLESGGKQCLLLAFDLLMMDDAYYLPMQKEIAKQLQIPQEAVLLATTHSHAAPLFIAQDRFGKVDDSYYEAVKKTAAATAMQAKTQKQAGKVGWLQKNFSEVGRSRRSEDRQGDVMLTLLSFADESNRPMATIVNYNCHPTVLSAANRAVSRDYPGALVAALENKGIGEFLFVNGAAGDVSTRFVRNAQTFDEVERLGGLLAEEVEAGIQKIAYEEANEITLVGKEIQPPLKALPSVEELNKQILAVQAEVEQMKAKGVSDAQLRLVHTKLQGAYVQRELKAFLPDLDQTVRMSALAIGNGSLLFVNGEWFSAPAADLIQNSPYEVTGIVGYTNGIAGYFPDEQAFQEGGYEALSCRFAAGIGECLAKEGQHLLASAQKESE